MIDYKTPIKMNISIASAQEAIEYWLKHEIFKNNVNIESVTFTQDEHFIIKFDKNRKEDQ